MVRQIYYKIEEQDKGKNIGMFLKEKEYSRAVIIQLKKTECGIKRNGFSVGVREQLQIGDTLEIAIQEEMSSENIRSTPLQLEVLYEDEDILVINKPHDTPIHPSINNYDNTLANGVVYYYEQQGRPHVFRCINRLDRDTTGTTVIAKNVLSASILARRVEEKGIRREYIAFVEGVTQEEGVVSLPIGRAEGSIIQRQVDEVKGQPAVTHYKRIQVIQVEGQSVSVIALELETGRTHQIRVHMAAIGHPLLGDFLYNENNHMLKRQALHASRCSFYHPITGAYKKIEAPLPKDMAVLLSNYNKSIV